VEIAASVSLDHASIANPQSGSRHVDLVEEVRVDTREREGATIIEPREYA
jgi:hypothetical protein